MEIAYPTGFRAAGTIAGLKESGRPDLAVIISDFPCTAVASMTRNRFPGAPVVVSSEHLRTRKTIHGIIINSGQANACTGRRGEDTARQMCRALADVINCQPQQILVASTGVIGHIPDLEKIRNGLPGLVRSTTPHGWNEAALGIMTTDTRPKIASRKIRVGRDTLRIVGIAKGSGMIHPNMATMLAFLATDARINQADLRAAFRTAVDRSFHSITVDGDTSTSDMAVVLANGAARQQPLRRGTPDYHKFQQALTDVCADLARAIAADGEGATRLVTVEVSHARTEAQARDCAMAIARSSLVKCAIFGRDPNWGRLACAVGNSNAHYNPDTVVIRIGPTRVFDQGRPVRFDEATVHDYLANNQEVRIRVDLKAGDAAARVWTCDLTYDYVKINAEYRT